MRKMNTGFSIKTWLIMILCGLTMPKYAYAELKPAIVDDLHPPKSLLGLHSQRQRIPTANQNVTALGLFGDAKVIIRNVRFKGGAVYSPLELYKPFLPYLQKPLSPEKIKTLVNEISKRYKSDGYLFAYARIQGTIADGTLTVVLIEGGISRSEIKGASPKLRQWLNRLASNIESEKPLTKTTFERNSLLMEIAPGANVSSGLHFSDKVERSGTLDVVARTPHEWELTSSTQMSKGQNLAVINGVLNNLTSRGDQLGLTTLVPLDKDSRKYFVAMNWTQYLSDSGLVLQLRSSVYQEHPKVYTYFLDIPLLITNKPESIPLETRVQSLQIRTGFQLGYPLILSTKEQLNVAAGLDYINKYQRFEFNSFRDGQKYPVTTIHQRTDYPALTMSANGAQRYKALSVTSKLSLRKGLDRFGQENVAPEMSNLNFILWTGEVGTSWNISERWKLSMNGEGNWSPNALPVPEQPAYGGHHYGRAYADSEAAGDYGYGGEIELRYMQPIGGKSMLTTVQPYILMDAARTGFNHRPQVSETHLASMVSGIMFGDKRHYTLSVEAAKPVGDVPSDRRSCSWRYNLFLTWDFSTK